MVKRGVYKGIESLILENDYLKATFLPNYGGKLASLINKKTSREFLFQSNKETLEIPEYGSPFSMYDSSGFDEVFPSIDACPYPDGEYKNLPVPDHGEVWAMPWKVEVSDTGILAWVISEKFNYKLEKKVILINDTLETSYKVTNLSDKERFKFIWTPHALLNCSTKTELITPKRLNKVMSVEHSTEHLGQWGRIHKYPLTISIKTGSEINLALTESIEANNCEKFYFLDTMEKGESCGIIHKDTNETLIYTYDTDKVPYLGVWKTQGGYRGDYNIALEPCTGIYDDLYVANKIRKVPVLNPLDTYQWNFNIRITQDNK